MGAKLPKLGGELREEMRGVEDLDYPAELGMTRQQFMFCHEFVKDYCGAQAAVRAGYSKASRRTRGSEVLALPKVRKYIAQLHQENLRLLELDHGKILAQYAAMAFYDPRDLYDEDGKMYPPHKLPESIARCVEEIKYDRDGNFTGYKLAGRQGALDSLSKILDMMREKVDATVDLGDDLMKLMEDARKRALAANDGVVSEQ